MLPHGGGQGPNSCPASRQDAGLVDLGLLLVLSADRFLDRPERREDLLARPLDAVIDRDSVYVVDDLGLLQLPPGLWGHHVRRSVEDLFCLVKPRGSRRCGLRSCVGISSRRLGCAVLRLRLDDDVGARELCRLCLVVVSPRRRMLAGPLGNGGRSLRVRRAEAHAAKVEHVSILPVRHVVFRALLLEVDVP